VAGWYSGHLEGEDTYHAKVVLPNLLRVLALKKGEKVLDIACGEGYFARAFDEAGAKVMAADISPELIKRAKAQEGGVLYKVAPAHKLAFAKDGEFDAASCVLALQNIENVQAALKEARRVLSKKGRLVLVLNHPAFRVLKRSSWGWDDTAGAQYRRVDGYLSAAKVMIEMHPGKQAGAKTVSYHRSLQDFFKALSGAGFCVTRLEEWTSHRESQKGPRQAAEDTARREIPLFLMLEAVPIQ
jgi:ubiquinone/menaquinone biosynthesis C-methylase UbiE